MKIACYCLDNENHPQFKAVDSAQCVECKGPVGVKGVSTEEHYKLPTYRDLINERKQKGNNITNVNNTTNITVSTSLDIDTYKFVRKLRAIAIHTEALADELEAIENEWQCDCGSGNYTDLYSDDRVFQRTCNECGEHYAIPDEEEILKGCPECGCKEPHKTIVAKGPDLIVCADCSIAYKEVRG